MIDVIVGGQFGSEGKGKVAYYLLEKSSHRCGIRVGGPNSGHTANGKILKQLPVSALFEDGISIIAAGSYIDLSILYKEVYKYSPNRLYIDSKAVIIREKECIDLNKSIGSTLSGTGIGVMDRVSRQNTILAGNIKKLSKYIVSTEDIQDIIYSGGLIEGTQGFGLSNIHSPYYPYATSRDTTAAGFISEVGVSPKDVNNIYLVIRSYPIRVGGNSGPLFNETSWEKLNLPIEYTSVTRKIRRVGYIDIGIVKKAIRYNSPTHIILNHLDYIAEKDRYIFIKNLELNLNRRIDMVGLGSNIIEELV